MLKKGSDRGSIHGSVSKDIRRTSKAYQNLVKIDSLNFKEGMYIGTGIYVKFKNNYLLLCQNTILNRGHVGKISDFELSGGSIYVDADSYQKIITQYQHFSASQRTRLMRDYDNLKINVESAFTAAKNTSCIQLSATDKIIESVETQIKTVEPSLLIQCISAIRSADEYLFIHSINVSMLNGLMARWLELDPEQVTELISVGMLHDMGKLKIDDKILNKPEALTYDEFEIIKMHPVYSYNLLVASGISNKRLLAAVRGHHEKLNGQGYPSGLSGDQIGLYSRITAISDIYDAMVAERVYKAPSSPFSVLDQFSKDKFSNLDIQLVNMFLDKMTLDMVGKKVVLSNGDMGIVLYVDRANLAFPIVRVNDRTIITSESLKCVSTFNDLV